MRYIYYPKDLSDIAQGAVNAGKSAKTIYREFSQDRVLKQSLNINNDQIKSAIEDAFMIFKREIVDLQ